MHPILLRLGPITVYTYGFLIVVGFLAACWLASLMAMRVPRASAPLAPAQLVDLMCVTLLAGIAGGRLFYAGLHWRVFASAPLELFAIWHGGLVWYGGLLGGMTVLWVYARKKRVRLVQVWDQLVAPLALGHAIGRIGCFMNGCCYGKTALAWLSVRFPGEYARVMPAQLLESIGLLILCGMLVRHQRAAAAHPGQLAACYGIGYGTLRFMMEFLRGDQRPIVGILTLQQLVSIALVGYALSVLAASRRRSPIS